MTPLRDIEEKTKKDKSAVSEIVIPLPISEPPEQEVKDQQTSQKQETEEEIKPIPQDGASEKVITPVDEKIKGKLPKYVTLNFDKADIEVVLQSIADIAKVNFIITPGVTGTITMQTTQKIPVSELFSVMETVLEVNGMAMIKSGHYYKVMPVTRAKDYPVDVYVGKKAVEGLSEDIYVSHVIPLDYISADDMAIILASFMPEGSNILKHKDLNMLIINSYQSNVKRLLKLVEVIDKPVFQSSEELFVYYVENGDAAEIANILNSIYGDKKEDDSEDNQGQKRAQPKDKDQDTEKVSKESSKSAAKEKVKSPEIKEIGLSIDVEGDLSIVADTTLNALIVKTSPRNYRTLLKTIKKLDVLPRQVLIEVLIAEITLDDSTEFGLEWAVLQKDNKIVSDNIKHSIGISKETLSNPSDISLGTSAAGLNYMVYKTDKFLSILNAKADEDRVNILSSPHILASDNKSATISITDQVPIPKETTDENNKTTVTYEFKDAGIALNVTPKINEKGLVSMNIEQEVSNYTPEGDVYTFSVRKANTSLTVMDGQTIVIGGLIRDQKTKTKDGVPLLMDIPIFGFFFGHTSDIVNKTELIILITPHVISTLEDANKITNEFQEKVNSLKKEIGTKKEEDESS